MFVLGKLRPMRVLSAACLLGILSACAPTTTTPESRLSAQTTFTGALLSVTVVNEGPYELQLENVCPRPFELQVAQPQGSVAVAALAQQLATCSDVKLPPQRWPVRGTVTAAVVLNLPSGRHEMTPTAVVRVKVAPGGKPQGEYRTLRVTSPTVALTVP